MHCRLIYLISAIVLALPIKARHVTKREIGGEDAMQGQITYIVSIQDFSSHICGGSIISKNFILTAGHCCEKYSPTDLTVVAGTTYLDKPGIIYEVQEIVLHPAYERLELKNDICLLRLEKQIKFSNVINMIALRQDFDTLLDSEIGLVAGWGLTSMLNRRLPNDLQILRVETIPLRKCRDQMDLTVEYLLQPYHICASAEGLKGVCYGDSGGPLITYNNYGESMLTGIVSAVSAANGCGTTYPDIYTNISPFLDWINDTIAIYL